MDTKDDLIAAAQAVAGRLGTRTLSVDRFCKEARIGRRRVYRHFATWRELCAAAGLPHTRRRRIPDEEIFRAMRDACLAAGGVPTSEALVRRLPFSRHVLYRRSGTLPVALADFAAWADKNAPEFPYHAALAERIALYRRRARRIAAKESGAPPPVGPPWPATGARLAGDPLLDNPLQHEPINEYGVVLAFGMMAKELGYIVDSVAGAFPDCIAKRRVGAKRWAPVRVEFEFKSRNFVEHGHDPNGCDVIVCWEHDWADCPLEVLELKAAMARG